jgi:membrane protein YqaA with SNARE-associated domain
VKQLPSVTDYLLLELFLVNITAVFHPIPAEPTVALLLNQHVSPWLILLVVIVASFLGAVISFAIGRFGLRRIVPFQGSERDLRVQEWFRKYGAALLLASPWIPFAGDFVSLIAGLENYDLLRFVTVILAAKILKGAAVVYFVSFFLELSGLHF